MKIKEAMLRSINGDLDDLGIFSFVWFTVGMAGIYTEFAAQALAEDEKNMFLDDMLPHSDNKKIPHDADSKKIPHDEIRSKDLFDVLSGIDIAHYSTVLMDAYQFLHWLVEQDVPDGVYNAQGDELSWNDTEFLVSKLGEFVHSEID